ncbi:MAG: glycosyltransferase [Acidobacteria bacterium]|nr:glycosyltransferase [Acidobacteriota bacterium]
MTGSSTAPAASIVIPTFNEATRIDVQLRALAEQVDCAPFEVIVADNGSTDDLSGVLASYADTLQLRLIDASSRRGPAHARNAGARMASTDLLLFCDADDRVSPEWVGALQRALAHAAMVTGAVLYVERDTLQRQPAPGAPRPPIAPRLFFGKVPFAQTSNLGIRRALFEDLAGFDSALICAEDADLTIRAQVLGESLVWETSASIWYGRREGIRATAKQFFRYGFYSVAAYRKHRADSILDRSAWEMARPYAALVFRAYELCTSQRIAWIGRLAHRCGHVAGSVRFGVFCP